MSVEKVYSSNSCNIGCASKHIPGLRQECMQAVQSGRNKPVSQLATVEPIIIGPEIHKQQSGAIGSGKLLGFSILASLTFLHGANSVFADDLLWHTMLIGLCLTGLVVACFMALYCWRSVGVCRATMRDSIRWENVMVSLAELLTLSINDFCPLLDYLMDMKLSREDAITLLRMAFLDNYSKYNKGTLEFI